MTAAIRPTISEFARPKSRNGLQSKAYTEVRELIVSGEIPPGSFVSQRGLASRLGMSKTPVLVALERLQAEGFVEISPQQGVMIREMSIDDIVDHYEIRAALETHALRRLAGKLSADQTGRIEASLAEQRASLDAGDIDRFVRLDAAFHLTLAEFLGNRQIIAVMEQLRDKIHQIILKMASVDFNRLEKSIEEHTEIAEALLAGDGETAADRVSAHLKAGRLRLLNPKRL